jgi:hypothetical protein
MTKRLAVVVCTLVVLGVITHRLSAQKPAPPVHEDLVTLHKGHTYAPPSTHKVAGQEHVLEHVTTNKVPGAKAGAPLPAGHYPLARLSTPRGGTSKQLGAGQHHLTLNHQNGQWHVYAATAQGKVVKAHQVSVGNVQNGRLPSPKMKAGSLILIFALPVAFDPFTGLALFVPIVCVFP